MDGSAEFGRWKTQRLRKADLSRKGSVDEDAAGVVQLLNSRDEFFTTSSCSGRILLMDGSTNGFEVQKQNCCWLLVSHKPCVKDDVLAALKRASGIAVLKFEPFVLHVQCRQLRDAQVLDISKAAVLGCLPKFRQNFKAECAQPRAQHSVAVDSGFRNSGITMGKRGKTILAVRSTHGLEVPLSHKGKLMVTEEYIEFLLNIANQKMEENKRRIERFYNCLQHALERETTTDPHSKLKEKKKPFCPHEKKRNPGNTRGQFLAEDDEEAVTECDDDPGVNVTFFPEHY